MKFKEYFVIKYFGDLWCLVFHTRDSIKLHIQIILRKSMDEGEIHDIFKLAYKTPIQNGIKIVRNKKNKY